MFYLACQTCRKKVTDEGSGYFCMGCNKTYENCNPTYNFSMKISDMSGGVTMGCLGETGEEILGMKCKDFFEIKDNLETIKNLRSAACFKNFNMTIRAKKDGMSNS